MSADITTPEELLKAKIASISQRQRHLDGPPRKFKVVHQDYTRVYGIAEMYASTYGQVAAMLKAGEPCRIILTKSEAVVDDVPFCCLKTLLLMNITNDPELSKTCVVLFQKLIENTSHQDVNGTIRVSSEMFLESIKNLRVTTPYAHALIKGIYSCAYPKEYRKRIWDDLLDVDQNRYQNLRYLGYTYLQEHPELESEEDIIIALRKAYQQSTRQKGFKGQFASDLSNMARGMAFLVFMNHPEVFQEYDKSSMLGVEDGD